MKKASAKPTFEHSAPAYPIFWCTGQIYDCSEKIKQERTEGTANYYIGKRRIVNADMEVSFQIQADLVKRHVQVKQPTELSCGTRKHGPG